MALSGTVPPPCSCLAVLRLHGFMCPVAHTWTGSVWFICSLMSWMLPRIFFWWPASVTPIRSKSLLREKKIRAGGSVINIAWRKLKCKSYFSPTSKHTLYNVETETAARGNNPWNGYQRLCQQNGNTHPAIVNACLNATYFCFPADGQEFGSQRAIML